MIIILCIWLAQFIILKTFGKLAIKFTGNLNLTWFGELMLGYCTLSAVSVILSLFIPLNSYVFVVLLLFSIPVFIYNSFTNKTSFYKPKITELLIALLVLILTVPVPNHGDSAFYHAQALQWVEKYSVVPGLANFFGRLAFNSSFFTTEALFSVYPFSDISSRFLNGFLVMVWFVFLFQKTTDRNESLITRTTAVLFALISILISRGWISTIAPDVTTGLFMMIISYHFILAILNQEQVSPIYLIILLLTSITIKLPAALLLPILLFYPGIYYKHKWKFLLIPFVIGLPWAIRNVILSGYLVYPYLPLWIWQPDWLVPDDLALIERAWISSWARIPAEPWQHVLSLPFTVWFPHWFKGQYLINQAIVLLFSINFLWVVFNLFLSLFKKQKISKTLWLLSVWCGVIFVWFITAPDFRFGYGLILPFLMLTFLHYTYSKFPQKSALLVAAQFGFVSALIVLTAYVINKENTALHKYVLIPQAYPTIQTTEKSIDHQIIQIAPGDESCWNCPLPCINDDLFPFQIEMRGESVKQGFKPKKQYPQKSE
jgi:hypothetical protein